MPVFGKIKHSQQSFTKRIFHKNETLTSASVGVQSVHLLSQSRANAMPERAWDQEPPQLSESGSHWSFIRTLFYLSASCDVSESIDEFDAVKYNNPHYPQFTQRYESSASVFYIPQQYFGEKIKPKSFEIIDESNIWARADSSSKQIIVKDDGYGNLYSTNADVRPNSNQSISSSDNYVGNIYYESGIAVITATSSWSGSTDQPNGHVTTSIDYTSMGGSDGNYTIKFNSTQTIWTREFIVKINPKEFNTTLNPTARGYVSSSKATTKFGKLATDTPYLSPLLSTGSFNPYITAIQLYEKQGDEPMVIANLPRPVQVRDDMHLVFRIRLDQ